MPLENIWSMELREVAHSYRSLSLEFRYSTTMPYDWLKLRMGNDRKQVSVNTGKGGQERFITWHKVSVRGLLEKVKPPSTKRQNLGVEPHTAVDSRPYTQILSE